MKKLLLLFLFIPTLSYASAPTRVVSYTNGTTIRSADVTSNENAIFNYLQTGVDSFLDGSIVGADISSSAAIPYSKLSLSNSILNADISSSAAIAYSKLNLATSIVNADISASAAIVDTKLNTISTAGKVSGAALTSFSSIPSGAGQIPVANLGTGTPTAAKVLLGDGSWGTSGALTLISATSFSSATSSGDITVDGTSVYFVNVVLTATSASTDGMAIRLNNDTGTNYTGVYNGFNLSNTAINASTGSLTLIQASDTFSASTTTPSYMRFYIEPQGTASTKDVLIHGFCYGINGASAYRYVNFLGRWAGSAGLTAFRIMTSGGSVTISGTVYLYKYSLS